VLPVILLDLAGCCASTRSIPPRRRAAGSPPGRKFVTRTRCGHGPAKSRISTRTRMRCSSAPFSTTGAAAS